MNDPAAELALELDKVLEEDSVVEAWVAVAEAIRPDGTRYEVQVSSPGISHPMELGLWECGLEILHEEAEVDG